MQANAFVNRTMPATADITDKLIRDNINRAVTTVFKTMLGRTPTSCTEGTYRRGSPLALSEPGRPQIVGSVGFVGDCTGMVYLHMDLAFARLCTGLLLVTPERDRDQLADEVINDAIGELTNMTVGSFKNALCDRGYLCKLTIPSILRGDSFSIEPVGSVVRHIYQFDCAEHRVVADILLKAGD